MYVFDYNVYMYIKIGLICLTILYAHLLVCRTFKDFIFHWLVICRKAKKNGKQFRV